jgi:mono/diheme cytochrome c family protein
MTHTLKFGVRCLAFGLGLAAYSLAYADNARLLPSNMPAAYAQECAACHTAYPPGMLPAQSWQRIMTGLDKHFGTDASLDPTTVKQLSVWLQTHAGTYKRVAEEPSQDRITRSAWFVRKHRKIDPAVWKHASVKSAANCAACHSAADQGDYRERSLQFPQGLDARYRGAWND